MEAKTRGANTLPIVQSLTDKDSVVVQIEGGATSLINKSDFILGPGNVNFYSLIKTVKNTNETLLSNSLSAVETYNDLRNVPGPTEGKLVYVRKIDSNDTNYKGEGTFQFRTVSEQDNGGTLLSSNTVTGTWRRINVDVINPRWFGLDSNNADINTPSFQSAINFAAAEGIPVKIPSGSWRTYSLFLTGSNIEMYGEAGSSLLLHDTSADSGHLVINNTPGVKLRRVKLDASGVLSAQGIKASSSNNLTVDQCNVSDYDVNIKLTSCNFPRVINSEIANAQTLNIQCDSCSNGSISTNYVTNIGNDSITVTNCDQFRITSNYGLSQVEADATDLPVKIEGVTSTNVIQSDNYVTGDPTETPAEFDGGYTSDIKVWVPGSSGNTTFNVTTGYPDTVDIGGALYDLEIENGLIKGLA